MLEVKLKKGKNYKWVRQQIRVKDVVNKITKQKWKWTGHIIRQQITNRLNGY